MIYELINKYKQMLLYIFFGVCTTAINTLCYHILYNLLKMPNIASTVVSWLLAVVFAFVTNKYFVFESKKGSAAVLIHEAVSFFGCRMATGVLDVAIMYVAVDILRHNAVIWKLVSNVIVIIINYIASRFFIFTKSK